MNVFSSINGRWASRETKRNDVGFNAQMSVGAFLFGTIFGWLPAIYHYRVNVVGIPLPIWEVVNGVSTFNAENALITTLIAVFAVASIAMYVFGIFTFVMAIRAHRDFRKMPSN